jgi:UDP-GlcNAc:undecaprenyl-phosphate GlcNAc-1-phosphate transferase
MPFYTLFLIAFGISFAAAPLVMMLANNSGAVALPGGRHIHTKPTPKFGGIAIALSVFVLSPFIIPVNRVIGSYIAASAIMLLLGVIDDIRGINWKIKLILSIIATSIIMFGTGIWIESLGNLFGFGEVHLGYWGIPFTFFAVFGVINAVNLTDGLNGLACGVSSIAFLSFAVFASMSGNETVFYLSLINLGATLGLFRYNYPRARIFMGDSGSMFLGFSLAVQAILLTQGREAVIRPMVPVIILGIPIFDTVRVLILRIINRKHPFRADKTHLHHLMMRSGIHPNHVVKVIWILSALMSVLAFVLYRIDGCIMLVVYFVFIASIGVYVENLSIIRSNKSKKTPSNGTLH